MRKPMQNVLTAAIRTLGLLAACLLLTPDARAAAAENLRVVAWDMRWSDPDLRDPSQPGARRVNYCVGAIREVKPDVLILQHVTDWEQANQVAEGLASTEYRVLLCSRFPGAARGQQVAILSRIRAYFTWSEAWHPTGTGNDSGGFAFAAVEAGKVRAGIFAVAVGEGAGPGIGPQRDRWLKSVESFKAWMTNRLDSCVVSGVASENVGPTTVAEFLGSPFEQPVMLTDVSANHFSVRLPADPERLTAAVLALAPAVCDVAIGGRELLQARLRKSGVLLPDLLPAVEPTGLKRITEVGEWLNGGRRTPRGPGLILGLAAGLLLVLVGVVWWVRRAREQAPGFESGFLQMPAETTSGTTSTVVVGPGQRGADPHPVIVLKSAIINSDGRVDAAAEERLRQEAAGWLREKFVNTILTDRSELLAHQAQGSERVTAVDDRLRRIEAQLQRQSESYEARIRELTEQLSAAREESRAVIQAKILQVRAEMEAAVLLENSQRE